MKKTITFVMAVLLAMGCIGCGSSNASQNTESETGTAETITEQTYAESTTEAAEDKTSMVKVIFDFNYEDAPEAQEIEVAAGTNILPYDGETPDTAPETPTREGYRFAGWDTEKNPTLVNGHSATEWPLNDYYLSWYTEVGPAMGVSEEHMELTEDTVLYARWVEKTVITTPEELLAMREDLCGWYELGCDIDLSETEWIPVGSYVSHYEYLNPTWWVESFRGEFDGAGHTITGLRLDKTIFYDDDNSSRKTIRNGVAALFGAVGQGGFVHDVTLDKTVIDVQSDIHYAYAAPLAGMVEGGIFTNCHVTNLDAKAAVTDAENNGETAVNGIYASISGMICGVWDGTVENCSVQGNMEVAMQSIKSHTGNAFIGGIMGDGYIPMTGCSSDMEILVTYDDSAEGEFTMADDFSNGMNIMCGTTTGLAAALINCPAAGSVTIQNNSTAGNAIIVSEGGYGTILGGADAVADSDFNGTLIK